MTQPEPATGKPSPATLEANKREMFDGMRAYHQSEISHANHAVTIILSAAGAANAAAIAVLSSGQPVIHPAALAWTVSVVVATIAFTVAHTTNLKIEADHKQYAAFGAEYRRTCRALGLYDPVALPGGALTVKNDHPVGQGEGYKKTKRVVLIFAVTASLLTVSFSALITVLYWTSAPPPVARVAPQPGAERVTKPAGAARQGTG